MTMKNNQNIPENLKSFETIINEMLSTYEKKNHDYGNSFDDTCDKFGLIAAAVRMNDKMSRINSLMSGKTAKVTDEKLEDTLKDLANYCIMTLMYIKKTKKDGKNK